MATENHYKRERTETVIVNDIVYQFESEEKGFYCPKLPTIEGEPDHVPLNVYREMCSSELEYVFRAHMFPQTSPENIMPTMVIGVCVHISYNVEADVESNTVLVSGVEYDRPQITVYSKDSVFHKHTIMNRTIDELEASFRPICDAFMATIQMHNVKCIQYLSTPVHASGRDEHKHQLLIVYEILPQLMDSYHCRECSETHIFSTIFFHPTDVEMYEFGNYLCRLCKTHKRKVRKLEEYEKAIDKLQQKRLKLEHDDIFECDESESSGYDSD